MFLSLTRHHVRDAPIPSVAFLPIRAAPLARPHTNTHTHTEQSALDRGMPHQPHMGTHPPFTAG